MNSLCEANQQGVACLGEFQLYAAMEHFQKAFAEVRRLCMTSSFNPVRSCSSSSPAPSLADIPSHTPPCASFVESKEGTIYRRPMSLGPIIAACRNNASLEGPEIMTMVSAAIVFNMALCYHLKAASTADNDNIKEKALEQALPLYAQSHQLLFQSHDIFWKIQGVMHERLECKYTALFYLILLNNEAQASSSLSHDLGKRYSSQMQTVARFLLTPTPGAASCLYDQQQHHSKDSFDPEQQSLETCRKILLLNAAWLRSRVRCPASAA